MKIVHETLVFQTEIELHDCCGILLQRFAAQKFLGFRQTAAGFRKILRARPGFRGNPGQSFPCLRKRRVRIRQVFPHAPEFLLRLSGIPNRGIQQAFRIRKLHACLLQFNAAGIERFCRGLFFDLRFGKLLFRPAQRTFRIGKPHFSLPQPAFGCFQLSGDGSQIRL